jgi:UDP-glucose 4-epimerase
MKIAVTGACGYIGSHTLVDLIQHGFEVISIDNNSRSTPEILEGVTAITGKIVPHYPIDMCHLDDLEQVFVQNPDIVGVIHFAAYKWVGESVDKPLLYYHNNLQALLNLLKCIQKFDIPYHVFSSSCSVYGNPDALPVTEETPLALAESPYAMTKQIGERIISDFSRLGVNANVLLRYFNPVGAHPSAKIGEIQPIPQNLVPFITQTAIGLRPALSVFGNDYDTRDGTCLRDYIHVSDIAHAHTLALQHLVKHQIQRNYCEVFNLGSGEGATVLEVIAAFERATGEKLAYQIVDRRAGDVAKIYANRHKATHVLGWQPQYKLDDMMRTAWQWQLRLQEHPIDFPVIG